MYFVNYLIATKAKRASWRLLSCESWGPGTDLGRDTPFPLVCEALKHCAKKSFICLVASVFKMKTSFKVR